MVVGVGVVVVVGPVVVVGLVVGKVVGRLGATCVLRLGCLVAVVLPWVGALGGLAVEVEVVLAFVLVDL